MAEGSIWTNRPAAEAGTNAPGVGLATRPAGAFYARTPRRRDAGREGDMFVVTLDRDRLAYVVGWAVHKTCRQCGERWWRVVDLPGGYPPDFELPATWAGGFFVREWVSKSLAHFVFAPGRVLQPASLVSEQGTVVRGLFAVGYFHEGPVAGHRRADQDFQEPKIPGWEVVSRYCLPRPGHHVRAVWRCWLSKVEEEARGTFAPDVEEEVTLCRRCAEAAGEGTREEATTA